jgi:hypothetical protein
MKFRIIFRVGQQKFDDLQGIFFAKNLAYRMPGHFAFRSGISEIATAFFVVCG